MATIVPALVGLLLVLAACNRSEPEGRFAQAGSEEPPAPTGPLRYASTIAAAQKPGETVATLVEVASSTSGRMRAIVAVIRPPAPSADSLTVEIWTFDQRNEAGVLERTGEPTPALRLHSGDRKAPALVELRREAALGQLHRLLGVAASDPAAAISAMTTAAATVRALDRPAADRLAALEVVVRGLDDGPLLEDDLLARALDDLIAGTWSPSATRMLSEHRAEITTSSGATLEMHKVGDGWAVAAIR
jgi:hypothetical protein